MTLFGIGAHVKIKPLEDMPARVVEIAKTAEEGWIYVCRYISDGEAKTMRCFPDEVEPGAQTQRWWLPVEVETYTA